MEDINENNESNIIRIDVVNKVKENIFNDEKIYEIAELFKVFADSTRMKIICCLKEKELCVGELAFLVNTTQSAISHQLRVLKQAKLVKYRKEGKVVYYSLDDEHVDEIVMKGSEHIEEI